MKNKEAKCNKIKTHSKWLAAFQARTFRQLESFLSPKFLQLHRRNMKQIDRLLETRIECEHYSYVLKGNKIEFIVGKNIKKRSQFYLKHKVHSDKRAC